MGIAAEAEIGMKKLFLSHWPVCIILCAWFIFSLPFITRGLLPFPAKYLVTSFAPWSTSYGMPVKSASMPDVITQIYPWKHITIESWSRGVVPLWNPYSFAGTGHAGNYQTAVFSPINLLYLILSQPTAWGIIVLLQPLLAGLCMYLFLKSEQVSAYGVAIGSVAYMFSGFLVVWMAYTTLGFAALVLPLCLFAVNKARRGKYYWALPLLSFAVAFSLVSGHFQISLYVLLCTVLYMVYTAAKDKRWNALCLSLLFAVLGIGMATPQLWETFRAYAQSVRSNSFGKGEIIPWAYLITLFAPDFYGNPVTRNDWFGHYAEWAGFIGVIPLMAAGIALVLSGHSSKIFFVLMAFMSLLFALPTPLTDFMYLAHIPVLSTSSASRIICITSFSLSVLSAFGIDAIIDAWKKKRVTTVVRVLVAGLVFIAVFWIVFVVFRPLPADKLVIAIRNSVLPTGVLLGGLIVVTLGVFVPKKYIYPLLLVLVVFCVFDSVRFAAKWMPFEPRQFLYPSMPVIETMKSLPDIGFARVMGNFGNEFSGMFHIQGLEGYDAVYKKRYGELVSALGDGKIKEPSRSVVLIDKHGLHTEKFLQLMGVRYYLHKVSDGRFGWAYPFWEYPNYDILWRDATYELFENSAAFPRAYLVSSYTQITNSEQIITTLFSDDFDRRNSVILEEHPQVEPRPGDGAVTIESYMPEKIRFRVQTSVPKLLLLSDVYDDGWRAYVNAKESKIYRADYVLRAVIVPAGDSVVVMVYEPVSMRYGMYLSLVSLSGVIGYLVYQKFYAYRFI